MEANSPAPRATADAGTNLLARNDFPVNGHVDTCLPRFNAIGVALYREHGWQE
jgi:hypothetical protein